jgi:hypothetical protein
MLTLSANYEHRLDAKEHEKFILHKFGVKRIGIFGSFARGEETEITILTCLLCLRKDIIMKDIVYAEKSSVFYFVKILVLTHEYKIKYNKHCGLSLYFGQLKFNALIFQSTA